MSLSDWLRNVWLIEHKSSKAPRSGIMVASQLAIARVDSRVSTF